MNKRERRALKLDYYYFDFQPCLNDVLDNIVLSFKELLIIFHVNLFGQD